MHEGHRERLISKLIGGNTLLSDHEILEILLFYTIPRKNVNDLAHRLINSFGSLQGCFSADYHSLLSIEGVGHKTATFIVTLGEIQARVEKNNNELPTIFSFDSCKQMLINSFRGATEEKFAALFLDKQGKIIFRKIFFQPIQSGKIQMVGGFVQKKQIGLLQKELGQAKAGELTA